MHVGKGLLFLAVLILTPSGGHAQRIDQAQADRLLQDAATAYRAKQWDEAARLLRDFVRDCPEDTRTGEMRFFLAEACFQAGKLQDANEAYKSYLATHNRTSDAAEITARFRLGETAYLLGQTQEAHHALRAFVAAYPEHGHVQYALPYLIALASREGDSQEVIRLAEQLGTRSRSKNLEVQYLCAEALRQLGRTDEARVICQVACFEPALVDAELGYRFQLLAAELDWQRGPGVASLRGFQRIAVSRAPATYRRQALIRVAECCESLGDNRQAITALQNVLVEFPGALPQDAVTQKIIRLQANAAAT